MTSARQLLGPMTTLAEIRPPGRSFAEWHRFLEECREAGVAALTEDRRAFATPLGYALLRRWRWLEDAEQRGLRYDDAERAFSAAIERDSAALKASLEETERARARAMQERDPRAARRKARDASDLLDYADEVIRP